MPNITTYSDHINENKLDTLSQPTRVFLDQVFRDTDTDPTELRESLEEYAKLLTSADNPIAEKPPLEKYTEHKNQVINTIIDNISKSLEQAPAPGNTHNVAKLTLAINGYVAKLLFENLQPLINIQPMTGPVSQIFAMQYKHNEDVNRLTLEVVKNVVEARSYRLSAAWSLEAVQEGTIYGLDLEAELMQALGQEIAHEYYHNVFHTLKQLGGEQPFADIAIDNETDPNSVIVNIMRACNDIGKKTRRGCGNTILCGLEVGAWLYNLMKDVTNDDANEQQMQPYLSSEQYYVDTSGREIKYIGTLNGTIRVYVADFMKPEDVIVGYRGASEIDGGYTLCPYQPAVFSLTNTYEPVMTTMTRYGQYFNTANGNDQLNLSPGSVYFNRLTVTFSEDFDLKRCINLI